MYEYLIKTTDILSIFFFFSDLDDRVHLHHHRGGRRALPHHPRSDGASKVIPRLHRRRGSRRVQRRFQRGQVEIKNADLYDINFLLFEF
jgi:hypothetical protein